MKRHMEINTYEHEGINVTVKIDYDQKQISLVDPNNKFKRKEYTFATRGLEYMHGWQRILDAMKNAVDEATKLMEADLAEESRITAENIIALSDRPLNDERK